MAPSVKRQRTDDVQSRLSQTSGLLDWNALLVRRGLPTKFILP
jgi:hypothetical protein